MNLHRIARYLLSGSTTTLLMIFLVYIFSYLFHFHYLVATSAAFIITLFVSYIVHKYWTFQDKTKGSRRQFGYHTLLATTNFFINILLMYILVGILKFPTLVSQLTASGLIAVESFTVYKISIFRQKT